MSVWDRLSWLISANINALLDKAEDPELMLAQVIREMEEGLTVARGQAATVIAAARRLGRELEHNRAASSYWKDRARLALDSGREDLARQALGRKVESDDQVSMLQHEFAAVQQSSAEVKTALHALETRLAEARRKQRILLVRHQVARVRLRAQRTGSIVVPEMATPFDRFRYFEEKLEDMEDQLLAQVEVTRFHDGGDGELANLEKSKRMEEELEALRKEIVRGGQETSAP